MVRKAKKTVKTRKSVTKSRTKKSATTGKPVHRAKRRRRHTATTTAQSPWTLVGRLNKRHLGYYMVARRGWVILTVSNDGTPTDLKYVRDENHQSTPDLSTFKEEQQVALFGVEQVEFVGPTHTVSRQKVASGGWMLKVTGKRGKSVSTYCRDLSHKWTNFLQPPLDWGDEVKERQS